ncbi:MAG: DUF177 domain-containing protein [Bacteroidia bacterium]|nr:DUF177 domain-containing protein [Bacteroidia bacterium]
MDKYVISYRGLKEGEYDFSFDIDNVFFKQFDASEISEAAVGAKITLYKKAHLIHLTFDLKGTVKVECDRCLGMFDMPVKYEGNLYIKFGDVYQEESDEIIIVPNHEAEINVAQYLYEFICLSIPYRRVHPDKNGKNTCNREMIGKIEELSSDKKETNINLKLKELKKLLN